MLLLADFIKIESNQFESVIIDGIEQIEIFKRYIRYALGRNSSLFVIRLM